MSSVFGKKIIYSLFGEAHGEGVGMTVSGLPAGIEIDTDMMNKKLSRRRPGSKFASPRREADEAVFLSGVHNGYTTGAPLSLFIRNADFRSGDYEIFGEVPRPSHADYVALQKYGKYADLRGGGHFSGRLTAPIVALSAILEKNLKKMGISTAYHISDIADIHDDVDIEMLGEEETEKIKDGELPIYDESALKEAKKLLQKLKTNGDSVGASCRLSVKGLKAGLGEPFFDSLESVMAAALFSVPGVKAVEFGKGVEFAKLYGSAANDAFTVKDGRIETLSNNSGGINGGISNGMPVSVKVTFRPTSSIALSQKTLNIRTNEMTDLKITGRHDPCIAVRGVVALEAVIILALYDLLSLAGDRER